MSNARESLDDSELVMAADVAVLAELGRAMLALLALPLAVAECVLVVRYALAVSFQVMFSHTSVLGLNERAVVRWNCAGAVSRRDTSTALPLSYRAN